MRNTTLKFATLMITIVCVLAAGLVISAQERQKPAQPETGEAAAVPVEPGPAPVLAPPPATPDTARSLEQIVDNAINRETMLGQRLRGLKPIVETYLQSLDKDQDLAFVPTDDRYFLGKMDFSVQMKEKSLLPKPSWMKAITSKVTNLYSVKYLPEGFAQMLVVAGGFNRQNYDFEYVRREFLGEVRTVVFDVQPKKEKRGSFKGRIWVEDQDYNIVRFNGTYGPSTATKMYFHFDSWRELMGEGLWLPAYVYTEESDMGYLKGLRKLRFKGQTRLWGYNVGKSSAQNELTTMIVDAEGVRDNVSESEGMSPVRALRNWQRQAEDNLIQRLEKAGLLAPDGEVNKVLETVATNLEVTNNLEIVPAVRARVLLTSPLESFTIGHTIVLSRGLVDVLPDEASLAMIIAHELAHISLGHRLDTKYAFSDRMLFEDFDAFRKLRLKRDELEEVEADKKAADFLKSSPYNDKLGNAGLFLKALDDRAPQLQQLLKTHIGNSLVKGSEVRRMASLMQTAPQLETAKVDQIAALPLGGRVRVDPWSARIELLKSKPVALLSAREKMPFEVTPIYLYLTRQNTPKQTETAAAQTSGVQ
jgi:hypothetical protein